MFGCNCSNINIFGVQELKVSKKSNHYYFSELKKYECQDSTALNNPFPLCLEKGKGSIVYDVEKKTLLDLSAGFGSLPLGHHPKIIQDHLKKYFSKNFLVQGMGDLHPTKQKIKLFQTLKKYLPNNLSKGILSITGSGAVESAIKTCLLQSKNKNHVFITFRGSYHGVELSSLSLTAQKKFKSPFSSWLSSNRTIELLFNGDLTIFSETIKKIRQQKYHISGVILEPIQGRSGVHVAKKEWLAGIRKITLKEKIPLIFDEILTGFGRTGINFFSEEVEPDLLCLGKSMANGLPISVCFGNEPLMSQWPLNQGEAIHTGTFYGYPLACDVARITIDSIFENNLPKRAQEIGDWFLEKLKKHLSNFSQVKDIRGKGLMLTVEFYEKYAGVKLMHKLNRLGVLIVPSGSEGQCLSLTPALTISKKLLEDFIDKLVFLLKKKN